MRKSTFKFIKYLYFFPFLISCQSIDETALKSSLSSDNGQLDLSLSTPEQQNIEKALAKKSLLEAREKRTIVETKQSPNLNQKSEINIALYARQTLNVVGKKIYNRVKRNKDKSNACLRFTSSDDAQRFFLDKQGPKSDFWNLDPDGDGFACDWDPSRFRNLLVN